MATIPCPTCSDIDKARTIVRAAVIKNPLAPLARIEVHHPAHEFVTSSISVVIVPKCWALQNVARQLAAAGRHVRVEMVQQESR